MGGIVSHLGKFSGFEKWYMHVWDYRSPDLIWFLAMALPKGNASRYSVDQWHGPFTRSSLSCGRRGKAIAHVLVHALLISFSGGPFAELLTCGTGMVAQLQVLIEFHALTQYLHKAAWASLHQSWFSGGWGSFAFEQEDRVSLPKVSLMRWAGWCFVPEHDNTSKYG